MVVSGIGCSLVDYIYSNINFNNPAIKKYFSKNKFDGGLFPGGLVFVSELENYTKQPIEKIIADITGDKEPDAINIGGPAIASLIHCAQMVQKTEIKVKYYGSMGDDDTAEHIKNILKKTPINYDNYKIIRGYTPSTYVFSDPNYDNGQGERMFVNNIGMAGNFSIFDIEAHFFKSNILLFGATALLPDIHDNLNNLLKRGKESGCVNVVSTVYDFRNTKINPDGRWPLGDDDTNYKNTDLLITNYDEALKLSNTKDIDSAANFFIKRQTPAFIITHGANPLYLYSGGSLFKKVNLTILPVSEYIKNILKTDKNVNVDTTGCGDNFVGGVLASTAYQMLIKNTHSVDLPTACAWGVVSGGFAKLYLGGTYLENIPGEKAEKIQIIFDKYQKQIKNILTCVHNNFQIQ